MPLGNIVNLSKPTYHTLISPLKSGKKKMLPRIVLIKCYTKRL